MRALLVLWSAQLLNACSCLSVPICMRVSPEMVAFTGVAQADSGFLVERVLAGLPAGTRQVKLAPDDTTCAITFPRGQRFLVLARRLDDGSLATSICDGSRPIAEAAADIRFLADWAAGRTPTVLEGDVSLENVAKPNLAGLTVIAKSSEGRTFQGRVNQKNHYRIGPVAPGTYQLSTGSPKFSVLIPRGPVSVPKGGCGAGVLVLKPGTP
ncbi:MAG: hypothetical protein K2X03_23115 [Bryobacteraceae bacterium]|nr:hypothetical protein [Bryobacteraceae bacterium]